MSDNLDKQHIDWHSGFYAATCFVLNDEPFELLKEYELNKQPIRIDVLIKSKDDFTTSKDIAQIFRLINVVEYKNPTDSLNYTQYYKTVSYACLYIGNSALKDKIRPKDVTVSIFRDRYPKKLFKQLAEIGCSVKRFKPGIYYVEGKVLFPTQIVVINQLKGDEYLAFKSLSNSFSAKDALKFMDIAILTICNAYELFGYFGEATAFSGIIMFYYKKYLWRWDPFLKNNTGYVSLNKQYKGILQSSYDMYQKMRDVEVNIEQDLFTVKITMKSGESKSASVTASIEKYMNINRLVYTYVNVPEVNVKGRSCMHYGTAWFDIEGINELRGVYFTDRQTIGKIHILAV